jgi:hypothetical protein
MNNHAEGEHLTRIYEVCTRFVREIYSVIHVNDLMNVGNNGHELEVPYDPPPRIRQETFNWNELFPPDRARPGKRLPAKCKSMGELDKLCELVVTQVARAELRIYGILVNEINFTNRGLPASLIRKNRDLVGRTDEVRSMKRLADALKEQTPTLTEKGVSPDVAATTLSGSVQGATLENWLIRIFKTILGGK